MKFPLKLHPRLLLFSLLLSGYAGAQPVSDSLGKKIDGLFSYWNNTSRPGCAIGIVRNDSMIYAKGYGMANLEYGIPITEKTIFHMASVSKQFTAYSIVLLAQKGKLKLDDDIHKWLPWFPDLHEKITILHLLNHTSGIRDQWQLLAIAGTRLDDVITQEQIIKVLGKQQALNFKPGEAYSYSNSGFTLLAEIVKSVTGQSLRKFTDSAIFKPLGMQDTHFHDDYTEIVKDRAYSYQRKSATDFSNSILSYSNAGATSLFTNVNDMAKWIVNFYKPVVGTTTDIDQLVQNGKLNNGVTLPYARGIIADRYKGWRQYSHSGGDAGFRTYVSVFPDLKLGIIVFSNVGDINVYQKAYQMADLFMHDTTAKVSAPEIKMDSGRAMLKNGSKAKSFAGSYIAEDGTQFSFSIHDNKMYWEHYGSLDLLYSADKDSFVVVKTPEVKFVFSTAAGKKVLLNEYWPDNTRQLEKYASDSVGDEQLKQYAGVYYSPELDCKYGLVVKGHELVMTNHKYDDSPVKMSGPDHLFTNYWWMRHLLLIRNSQGKITGFEVNDGRIMHLRFNKMQEG